VFPSDAQQQIRVQLATTLQGVLSQCLLPKIGGGRVAAREIMIATDGIRSLIREGKTPQMLNMIQTGKKDGMSTLEMSLLDLVNRGLVLHDDAISKANRPEEVRRNARVDAAAQAKQTMDSMDDMHATFGTSAKRR